MADVDLTGEIAAAIDGAIERGPALVLGYVTEDGAPALSFRGSAQVHSPDQVAVWARKRDEGLAHDISTHPRVTLLYYSRDTPGAGYLSIRGRARVAPELNGVVYDRMVGAERSLDPERKGIAVLIDVDVVDGFGAEGRFHQERPR
jgi:hypothetical protein